MSSRPALHTLLNLHVDPNAPVFNVYSAKVTPRLQYACGFIFNHVLKVNFVITTSLNAWKESKQYRINYSNMPQAESLHIAPHTLLFETTLPDTQPVASFKNDLLYFYSNAPSLSSDLHFDVFSAVFYCISRCEEWLPFTPDAHGRFEAKESYLYKNNAHLSPVVDQWIYELKAALVKKYPGLVFPAVAFKAMSTIDVDNLFAYRSKGLLRTLGASVKDLLGFNFKNFSERLRVVAGSKKDPFDIYEEISEFCLAQHIPLFFFFLFRTGTTYDRTVDPESPAFEPVLSVLKKNGALAGLHPSYHSAFESGLLEKEVRSFSKKLGEPVTRSRQHYLRFDIRTTPHALMQLDIQADFSMGFASSPGFRAGTSQPFYYYDFKTEKKEELLFVPFCAMDGAYFVYNTADASTAFQSLWNLALEIKKVNGLFITVFHERTFYDHLYKGFGPLYKNLYLKLKDL